MDLSIEITEPSSSRRVHVVGQADSGLGCDGRETVKEGTFLGVIEVERRQDFSMGERNLLAHLAILRELGAQQREASTMAQGFFTDGERYTFVAIRNDGTIKQSAVYGVDYMLKNKQPQLKTIFNFIITILDNLRKSMSEIEGNAVKAPSCVEPEA